MKREVLRMERVTCIKNGREVLNNFNFQMFEGEVMGLVPLDSYGLNEFVDCVQNNRQLFYGRVYICEKLVNTYAVCPRAKNNVYSIFKDENLVNNLSAADNIFIIREGFKGHLINERILNKQLERLFKEIGIEINTRKKVVELTILEKYIVEIVKAIVAKTDIIIVRDLASSLHSEDMEKLKKVIRYYAEHGMSFIYISARMEALSQMCDRVSLMSHGRIIKVLEHEKIAENLEKHYFFPYQLLENNISSAKEEGQKVFICEDVCYNSIQHVSFDVEKGECLLVHNYNNFEWEDFIAVLLGAKVNKGRIWWEHKGERNSEREVALILKNPTETMLFPEMSYEDNLCLNLDHRIHYLWGKRSKRKSIAKEIAGEYVACKVKDLSLREKYELVYHKIILQKPEIIFCFFPYRNVDVKTRQYTNSFLKKYLSKGIAVVIITLDMMDSIALADRILLFGKDRGRMIFDREEFEKIAVRNRESDSAESTKKEEDTTE